MSFNYETELVMAFLDSYSIQREEIIVREMPIRFGNVDLISIKNTDLPFTKHQTLALSKPACSLVFTKIKNERPITKNKLIESVGLSKSTLNNVLYELMGCNLIIKRGNNYLRESKFVFPKTIITGYEAKLRDFNKAFYQAKNNKEYVDYSYLIFPKIIAEKIIKNKIELLEVNGLGLVSVSVNENKILLKAKKTKGISDYIRLLNLVKANNMHTHELGIAKG